MAFAAMLSMLRQHPGRDAIEKCGAKKTLEARALRRSEGHASAVTSLVCGSTLFSATKNSNHILFDKKAVLSESAHEE